MLRTARLITKSTMITSLLILGGCILGCSTLTPPRSQEVVKAKSRQKILLAPYDEVWRAAHTVLKYPIVNENQDTGIIETDYIKAQDGFIPPDTNAPTSGMRYKITMIFAKGKTQGQESVRLTIDKKIEKLRDFFSEAETLSSDGLEERIIFYRMERELQIAKGLRKAVEQEAQGIPQ